MVTFLGILFIIFSVLAGFIWSGGRVVVLFQPSELLIVIGGAIGIFLISNPVKLIRRIVRKLLILAKKDACSSKDYLELLVFSFYFYKFCKMRSSAAIELHIEKPNFSKIFNYFPSIHNNMEFRIFFCDYMRIILMDNSNSDELELMISDDLEIRMAALREEVNALQRVSDALPALGIVGAVLGVINAMSALNADPEILAHRIGGALMGTFLGVFVSYCVTSPISFTLEKYEMDRINFLIAVKAGIVAYARGNTCEVIVEFIRNSIPQDYRPGFIEVEEALAKHKLEIQNGYK